MAVITDEQQRVPGGGWGSGGAREGLAAGLAGTQTRGPRGGWGKECRTPPPSAGFRLDTRGGPRDPALASGQGCRRSGKKAATGHPTAKPGPAWTLTHVVVWDHRRPAVCARDVT